MKQLEIDGIPIAVIRKSIKNMYLRIQPPEGRVVITAPRRMPDPLVERFARERMDWVKKHLAAIQARAQSDQPGTVRLFGETFPVDYVQGRKKAVLSHGRVEIALAHPEEEAACRAALSGFCREQLRSALPPLLEECQRITGKRAGELRIRDMTSRWGTCNTATGAITLNLQLSHRPKEFLRYVLIHELTHLYEPSHNHRFYALMDGFLPGWQAVRKRLKRDF